MDGWMEKLQRLGRSPVRYSQRKKTDHTKMDVHVEGLCW